MGRTARGDNSGEVFSLYIKSDQLMINSIIKEIQKSKGQSTIEVSQSKKCVESISPSLLNSRKRTKDSSIFFQNRK